MAFREVVGNLRKTLSGYQSVFARNSTGKCQLDWFSTHARTRSRGTNSSAGNPMRSASVNTEPSNLLLVKASSSPNESGCRGYASKAQARYLKRKKAPVSRYGSLDPSQPRLGFEKVQALEDADENVKRIFSLEFGSGNDLHHMRKKLSEDLVRDGPDGNDDLAVNIARITEHIRAVAPHVENNKKDSRNKVLMLNAIDRRRKMLKYLRKRDYSRFERLLEELNISFSLPPAYYFRKTRRFLEKSAICKEAFHQRKDALMEFERRKREEELLEIARLKEELGKELGEEEKEILEKSREESSV